MIEFIQIVFFVLFVAGFVGIAALWAQRSMNRKREQNASVKDANKDAPPK